MSERKRCVDKLRREGSGGVVCNCVSKIKERGKKKNETGLSFGNMASGC